jgi:Holliday junction DNA helicase RuvB
MYAFDEEEQELFEKSLASYTDYGLIVPPTRTKVDKSKDDIFSPRSFDEYIGQPEAKELSHIMVQAAHNERRAIPNIMVVGEYGLGKTTLAKVIMREAGLPERMYDGTSVNKEFPEPGTFIIDEIHNLDSEIADGLNLKLDSGQFHIIGCTNYPGNLPSAFRSRFRTLHLKPYNADELKTIIQKVCDRKKVGYNKDALELLSLRSRFNARQAIMYLSLVFDVMSVNKVSTVNMEVVNDTLSKIGVDSKGLLPRDRKYLEALPDSRPVGLQYLSAVLGIDDKTIEEEVEPFLLRMGFIDRTQRGRVKIER